MKIAFLTPVWPADNETAILNQIVELKKNGFEDMHFFAFGTNIKSSEFLPKEFVDFNLTENIIYLKQPDLQIKTNKIFTKFLLIVKTIPLLIRTFFFSPKILFKSLFKKEYGEYKTAFKIVYLIQNLLGKKFHFDLIHCQYAPNGIWGAILKDLGFLNGNLITTFHGYGINKLPKAKPSNFYDFLISKSTFYTSNSKFTKNNAVKIGFPENKIHIIRVALDSNLYNFVERKYQSNKVFQILTVAALRNVKGIEYIIEAIKIIVEQNPDIKLKYQIVGQGYLEEKLKKIITDYNLGNYIKLLGFVQHDELKNIYKQVHLFVMTSTVTKSGNQEAQGLVFQEAQVCGLPVIGSNTGGIPEGMLDGKTGFIVPDKSPIAVAERIMFFYNNPSKIAEFGKEGRKFVIENYNIKNETQKLIKLYIQNTNSLNSEKNI